MNLYKVRLEVESLESDLRDMEDYIEATSEYEAELLFIMYNRDLIKRYHYNVTVEATEI